MPARSPLASTVGRNGRQWFSVMTHGGVAIGLTLALSACQSQPLRVSESPSKEPDVSNTQSPAAVLLAVAGLPAEPVSLTAVHTTDGAIFLRNIDAQIETLRQRSETTHAPRWKFQYASLLYFRARVVGDASDFDRSESLVKELLQAAPGDAQTHLLAARLTSARHRFDESMVHLETARQLKPDASGLPEAQSQLALALGDVDQALKWAGQQARTASDLTTLAYLGNLAVLEGNLPKAERLFSRAELRFSGTGPFVLSWLHTQHGIALLENGQIERANRYFRAAHMRLPGYYLASEHLAETELLLGRAETALALYEQVYRQTSNPEFLAPMAEAQKALGHAQAAAQTLQRAEQAWQQSIANHPQANWQHAAEFHLEQGNSTEALRLAQLNIGLRKDIGSWLLLARAEHASGHTDRACHALSKARNSGLNPPGLEATAKQLGSLCGNAVASVSHVSRMSH